MRFEDDFDVAVLNRDVWLPHYLPAWSSRAETEATYAIRDSCLYLTIPPSQGLWCAADHEPPLRVSGIQSGNFSGPVGSTIGQQPYRTGLTVSEEQETFWGWTPEQAYVEIRARGIVTQRSMVACWLVGLEDQPQRSAEICVAEIFGNGGCGWGIRSNRHGLARLPRSVGNRGLRGRTLAHRCRRLSHLRSGLDCGEG